jgi:hypothetical protein
VTANDVDGVENHDAGDARNRIKGGGALLSTVLRMMASVQIFYMSCVDATDGHDEHADDDSSTMVMP